MSTAVSLIAVLSTALLSSAAHADSTCSGDSSLMWTQPSTAEHAFQSDQVFRALVGEGDSPSDSFSVRLLHDAVEVESTVEVTEHPGNDPYEKRFLHTLRPVVELEEGERYTFEVVHESGDELMGRSVSTLVEAEETGIVVGMPAVHVLTAVDEDGEGDATCDYGAMRTFDLTLTPAAADDTERSVLHLWRFKSETDTWHYVRAWRVDGSAATEDLTLSFERNLDWGGCFASQQENALGDLSELSQIACAPEPLLSNDSDDVASDEANGPVDTSPRGCSSVGAVGGWAAMWLAGMVGLRRRR